MSKEPFDMEKELAELEKEMGSKFEDIGPAPQNTSFQENLKDLLSKSIEEKYSDQVEENLPENQEKQQTQKSEESKENKVTLFFKKWKKPNFPLAKGKKSEHKRSFKLIASFIIVVFMFTGLFWGLSQMNPFIEPVQAGEITITVAQQDSLGIDTKTAFILKSDQPLDEKLVKERLKIEPEISYKLEKADQGKEYNIQPDKELANNTIYKVAFDPTGQGKEKYSWAFQTKKSFRVLNSLPRNQATHVPVDTGLEITFSHENFAMDKIKDFFTISPQAEGRFEKHKKTLVFVPKKLDYATIYTVTLKQGLKLTDSEDVLTEDYSFSFETVPFKEESKAFDFSLDNNLTQFSTSEAPYYQTYFYKEGQVPLVNITLYSYPNAAKFLQALSKRDEIPEWSHFNRDKYREDFSKLTKVVEFETEFQDADTNSKGNSSRHYLMFPEALPAGFYAAEIKADEAEHQVWFQVTDLATYLTIGEKNALMWVNDLATQKPVSQAKVSITNSDLSYEGDNNGVVFIDKPLLPMEKEYAHIKSKGKEILMPLKVSAWFMDTSQVQGLDEEDYWKYLYLDRELYKPGDELYFWGVTAPRVKGAKDIKEVTLELSGTGYYRNSWDEGSSAILTQDIPVEANVFNGKIKLPLLKPDYYYLKLKAGDTILLTRGFSVETYQKPAYRLTLAQDKKAVFSGEKVKFTAQGLFFEGTPVPDLKLTYNVNEKNQAEGTVITDEQGKAEIMYDGNPGFGQYSDYQTVYMDVRGTLPETGEISASEKIYVFRSGVSVTAEAKRTDNTFTLKAKLSQMDLSKINKGEYLAPENYRGAPVPNGTIKGEIYRDVWTKVENGETYDFINKKVVKDYYYKHSEEHVEDFELVTDSSGEAIYNGVLDPEKSYYALLTAVDEKGRVTTSKVPIWQVDNRRYGYFYHLEGEENKDDYAVGENVVVDFLNNGEAVPTRSQGFLYLQGQKYINSFLVSSSSQYSFTFQEKDIPNVNISGVYFDGKIYHETYNYTAPFAKETKELKVQINTDKREYRPGEKVKLDVLVTDQKDKPVKANININLVDEALYSLQEQRVNLLNSLYNDYFSTRLFSRMSHFHPNIGGGAECGGEGDGERTDFRDNVIFASLQTNGSGKATVEFELPDNLTSWRVTYHALTADFQAGSGTSQLAVRLPFFVEVTGNDTYLEGDKPVIILRSYGEKLTRGSKVAYQMKLVDSQGQEKTAQSEGKAFTSVDWRLPTLTEDAYTLTVKGESGGRSDIITKEINVVKSYLERTVSEHYLLAQDLKVQGGKEEPTLLLFSDYEKSQNLRGLYSLTWSYGSRLEQQLARREARQLMKEYFPEESQYWGIEEEENLLPYQQRDGGLSILPYADSDLTLSARAAVLQSDAFDKRALAGYFYSVLDNEDAEDDKSVALLGLAALREPVLLELDSYWQEKDIQPAEKINLALAYLEIGSGSYAEKVLGELLSQYGEDLGATMRIKGGKDQDEIIDATTQMAVLAARLNRPEKHKLYQYILENSSKELLNSLEEVQILQANLKYMEQKPVSFTYELKGKKTTKSLENRETFELVVLPEDLATLKFSEIKGKVGLVATYTEPFAAQDSATQQDLKINRQYHSKQMQGKSFERGNLVEVVVSYSLGDKAPESSYEIIDILPAGMRYVSRPYRYEDRNQETISYPSEVKGQKLTFSVGKRNGVIKYYARIVSPGEFKAEPSLLTDTRNSQYNTLSQEDRIVIK